MFSNRNILETILSYIIIMPYGKKRFVRRSKVTRRRPARKSAYAVAKRALSLAKKNTKINEVKSLDTAYTTDITTSGAFVHLSAVAQGDGISNRDGNLVTPTSLQYTMHVKTDTSNAGTTLTPRSFRFIFFQDKQQVADTAPAITDLLVSASVNSFYSLVGRGRFKILKDFRRTINPKDSEASTVTYDESYILFQTRGYLKGLLPIRYNGSASTDVQKNGFYMFVISDSDDAADVVNINTRLNYRD